MVTKLLILLCNSTLVTPHHAVLTPGYFRPPAPRSPLRQEIAEQSKLAAPLAVNLIANYSLSIVSLSFVGKLGDTSVLAAAALGSTLSSMSGCVCGWDGVVLCGAVRCGAALCCAVLCCVGGWASQGMLLPLVVARQLHWAQHHAVCSVCLPCCLPTARCCSWACAARWTPSPARPRGQGSR